jgi:OOP family OmpA-OmpF porin
MSLDGPDFDQGERRRWMMWIGAAGAVATALVGMLGAHEGSVWRMPQTLGARVEQALTAAGFGGVEVKMNGQQARLHGVVADEASILATQRAAQTAAGAGGAWAGGVTNVEITGLHPGVVETPFSWRARREGARFILSGAAPSEEARAELTSVAHAAFPNAEVIDDMHVAAGAPSPLWREMAIKLLRDLARLRTGEVRMVDAQIVFLGEATPEVTESLRALYRTPPAPFRARIDLDGAELQGLDLSSGDAAACEDAFARVMENNVILFAPGSAAIDPQSREVLDRLASVALRCDRFTIEVAGHTDNQGSRALNMDLSQRRAQAVAQYLTSQSVAVDRLRATGYGPEHPRAPNNSSQGQAANRRIEFKVEG